MSEINPTETKPDRRKSPFGAGSHYYRLYRLNPALARRRLWEAYQAHDGRIKTTAKAMGCSRDTVRRVVKRAETEGPVFWHNRPTRPFEPRASHVSGSVRKLVRQIVRKEGAKASETLRDRYGIRFPQQVLEEAGFQGA